MKKILKETNQRGITLVALVITIVILLILAGIAIQALTNQGLFGRANEAKRESEIANIKEQIQLDIYEKQLEPPLGSITDEQLETILGKYGTVNKEDGTIVGITTGKGYEILLKDIYGGETVAESVPDGAIVTPVNDITTWLKTGEISKQYSYITIEQVIADSTCIESLMNNENAMKYLARSTEFADAICASETTMTYLGQSAYVDDTVLNSDLWSSAICNSEFFELVLVDKVPTMTSNTDQNGEAFGSSAASSTRDYYKAFTPNIESNDDGWESENKESNPYIAYDFNYKIRVMKFTLVTGISQFAKSGYIKVQASNDRFVDDIHDLTNNLSIQENVSSNSGNVTAPSYIFNISNNVYYRYYRIYYIEKTEDSSHAVKVRNLQFYGRRE